MVPVLNDIKVCVKTHFYFHSNQRRVTTTVILSCYNIINAAIFNGVCPCPCKYDTCTDCANEPEITQQSYFTTFKTQKSNLTSQRIWGFGLIYFFIWSAYLVLGAHKSELKVSIWKCLYSRTHCLLRSFHLFRSLTVSHSLSDLTKAGGVLYKTDWIWITQLIYIFLMAP